MLPLTVRSAFRLALLLAVAAPPVVIASCAKGGTLNSDFDAGGSIVGSSGGLLGDGAPGPGIIGGGGDGSGPLVVGSPGGAGKCNSKHPCLDFPEAPIMDPAAPPATDPSTMFGDAGTGVATAAPCVVEPADGALYPKNWLRPRILWIPGSPAQKVFEVRVHSDGERNDLVAYTTNQYYVMDKVLWQTIATGALNSAGQLGVGNLVGQSLAVTVRALGSTGGPPSVSASVTIKVAPAIADGALVYWTTASFDNSATNTTLQGFRVGDEGTSTALQANQVVQPVRATPLDGGLLTGNFQQVFCIGCHTATPDGNYVAFSAQWPWPSTLASIQAASPGAVPPWLSTAAAQNLSPNYRGNAYDTYYNPPAVNQIMLGVGTFSPGHYATGDRIYLATLGSSWNSFALDDKGVASGVTSQLAWFNLEWNNGGGIVDGGLPAATPCTAGTYPGIRGAAQPCIPPPVPNPGWGIVARNGDPNGAGAPTWSHNLDGQTDVIAYVSTNTGVKDGRMDCSVSASCMADIYTVPYTSNGPGLGGAGGNATKLGGASDATFNEYYPAFSPDDKFIAFNRVPAGQSMYDQPKAEIYVVPFSGGQGGQATPVTSGFPPPACANPFPAGAQNTWAKWAPNPLGTLPDGGMAPIPQVDADGNTYYWITFSSVRSPTAQLNTAGASVGKPKQQLYVAGIVVDSTGKVTAYAPIYLWNQSYQVNNLIPAWGEFGIPPGITPPPAPTAR